MGNFPTFVEPNTKEDLIELVTMGKLEGTLKWFKKDKISVLDGRSVEFYLTFFDTIGTDLLEVIEECHSLGGMYEAINSTYIALIPKIDSHLYFTNF